MSQQSRTFPALTGKDASALNRALSSGDVTVFVDGTALRLPPAARDAVLDLLGRLLFSRLVMSLKFIKSFKSASVQEILYPSKVFLDLTISEFVQLVDQAIKKITVMGYYYQRTVI